MRKYQARTLRLCTSLLGNPTLAEDASQEIFLKAYQALRTFRAKSSFSTWIYRISSNHCHDLLRKQVRQKTESWDALVEEQGEQIQQMFTVSDDPRTVLANADLADKILSCLPAGARLILTLREVEGLSYQEIAESLSCSLDAVKARLRRAREELQDKFRHLLDSGTSKE